MPLDALHVAVQVRFELLPEQLPTLTFVGVLGAIAGGVLDVLVLGLGLGLGLGLAPPPGSVPPGPGARLLPAQ
ncbi:MAG: hypothetical protein IRY85_04960, partial [Micromonosporaceae bacterium]|nr:hypothetical protein [Micromonosporaceae bacterium]